VEAVTIERQQTSSFNESFDACLLVAYQAAYRVLGNRTEAEDVAQEAMTRAYVRWRTVREYAEPFVVRVATNLALDHVRKQRPPRLAHATAETPRDGVDERLDLAAAIASLPRRQREVVALRYIADLSEEDVMRLLGCSAGTVKQHAHRGLAALRSSGHLKVDIT
jgi:RNA polymerase sigma factor (sigma-70 family)